MAESRDVVIFVISARFRTEYRTLSFRTNVRNLSPVLMRHSAKQEKDFSLRSK